MKIAVIGGGAAGLTAAGSAKSAEVVIFEHSEKVGKKIYITGKGRCNFTNVCDVPDFLQNVVRNAPFLRSTLSKFRPTDAVELLENNGCKTKTERGRRAFPMSDKASDVTKALLRYVENNGSDIRLDTDVKDLVPIDGGIEVITDNGRELFDRVIVASGGMSYPVTGSDGSMFKVLSRLGHTIVKPLPSLVGLTVAEDVSAAQGLTLKNIELSAGGVKPLFGDLMITANGISGPVVLTLSSLLADRNKPYDVKIDLKPAMTREQLDARILKDFGARLNKQLKNALDELLPKAVIPFVIKQSGIAPDKQINSVTKAERAALIEAIKSLKLTVIGDEGFERAVITRGGVDVREIDPKTMQSKIIKGLYFAGEAIDVDALTGGYNFHIALATGYVAGSEARKDE